MLFRSEEHFPLSLRGTFSFVIASAAKQSQFLHCITGILPVVFLVYGSACVETAAAFGLAVTRERLPRPSASQ